MAAGFDVLGPGLRGGRCWAIGESTDLEMMRTFFVENLRRAPDLRRLQGRTFSLSYNWAGEPAARGTWNRRALLWCSISWSSPSSTPEEKALLVLQRKRVLGAHRLYG